MIALGSDHGGYGLKQEIIRYLEEKGIRSTMITAAMMKDHVIIRSMARRQRRLLHQGSARRVS